MNAPANTVTWNITSPKRHGIARPSNSWSATTGRGFLFRRTARAQTLGAALPQGKSIAATSRRTPKKHRWTLSNPIFRLTSMTNPLIALAALPLVDEGRSTLDEPIVLMGQPGARLLE